METKRCSYCAEEKPIDAFHRRANRPGGRQSRCKDCRYQTFDVGVKRETNRRWRLEHRQTHNAINVGWRIANPEKVKAEEAVASAIKRGDLTRPDQCESCGSCGLIHAHHPDYSRPLYVEWLCPRCHGIAHR